MHDEPEHELAQVADSGQPLARRATELLAALRSWVPFGAGWLALVDPVSAKYVGLASTDLDDRILRYLDSPEAAREIEATGTNQRRPPRSLTDLPYPASELPTWAGYLLPAGFRQGVGVSLFEPGGRQVGVLGLLYQSPRPRGAAELHRLESVLDVIARGVDPLRTLALAARLVRDATAGVVIYMNGRSAPLPGLTDDELLTPRSGVLVNARARIRAGDVYSAFLWPLGDRQNPDGHIRVTVLAATEEVPIAVAGLVVLSPSPNLHGLTSRELEVLGFLVDGRSNQAIAQALVVSPRTVAAHVEHILGKLGVATRTLAAVRAEREGVYVPTLSRAPRGRLGR
jgi:DNA-binding CsgD family transcriptional regulator